MSKKRYFFLRANIKIFLLIFFTALFSNLFAQSDYYRFDRLTTEDGLSQNTVLCILQDSRHFMWMGTYDGLNRYDGISFKIYKNIKDDSTSISGWTYTAIVEDKNFDLWVASASDGLNRYNRAKDNFTRFVSSDNPSSLLCNRIRSLLIDKKKQLWIGTEEGLCRYDFKSKNFVRYDKVVDYNKYPNSRFIQSMCEDSEGNLWLGTWMGLIKFNPVTNNSKIYFKTDDKFSISGNFIGKVYYDSRNNLWIGTDKGLNQYDPDNDRFIRHINEGSRYSVDQTIRDITEGILGLWIATYYNGLQTFFYKTKTFKNYKHDIYDPESIGGNELFVVYRDKSGICWIGTGGGGVSKLYRRKSRFKHYGKNIFFKEGFKSDQVKAIIEDKRSVIWIGTFGGGLYSLDSRNGKDKFRTYINNPHNSSSLIDDRIRSLCEDTKGNLWIGTENGLSQLDPVSNRIKNFPLSTDALSNNAVFSVCQIKSGEILAGTYYGGLYVIDINKNNITQYLNEPGNPLSLNCNMIWSIYQDSEGIVWIGTATGGLNKFDIREKKFKHYSMDPLNPGSISDNAILNIMEDRDKNLWLGTPRGLIKAVKDRSNPEKLIFTTFTTKNGLPDNNIQGLVQDNKGYIWISTNLGISKFHPQKETFENFDSHDGLQSDEFYVNSCFKRKTGELLFGGSNGFNIFNPDDIIRDVNQPIVALTGLRLQNKIVRVGEKVDGRVILTNNITDTKEIILSYHHSEISFEFAALHYASPGKNSYAYIMEGLENNWKHIGNRHFVTYSHIPPGKYVFRVKASNNDKVWNNKGLSLKVIIIPPFYATRWFQVLLAVAIVLLVYFAFKWKIWSMKKRQSTLETLINEKNILNEELIKENMERQQAEQDLIKAKEKAEISEKLKTEFLAQMSHEIRSPINTIINFTELVKEKVEPEGDEEVKESFESIENAGKRIVRTIDLILNMSELQTGSYECIYKQVDVNHQVLKRICPEFVFKARSKNLELVMNTNGQQLLVTADEYSLVQIIVNIIDNAIKYTLTGKVEVDAGKNNEGKVYVKVSDTGIGISDEYLANIFTAFFQEQQGYSRQYEGNGLGLALVKKYCDINNAVITVESKKGVGSTFTVVFNDTVLT